MSIEVQQRIAPPTEQNVPNFSAAAPEEQAADSTGGMPKTSFRDLVGESMNRIKEEREAKKNNDFSGAKTDAEFLEKLAETGKPPAKQNKNELDKDDFLKLFVAQLQHQDPLNPDNGAEMASKLAQFNGVEQMINMNTGLKKLIDAQNSTKALSMVQYIGKEASLEGGRVIIKDGRFDKPSFSVPRDTPDATMQVYNTQGVMVAEQAVGFLKKGDQTLNWDGRGAGGEKVADGSYVFKIAAKDGDGAMSTLDIKTKAIITGVDLSDGENNLNTTLGKLKLAEIKSIGIPEVVPQSNTKMMEAQTTAEPKPEGDLPLSPKKLGQLETAAKANEKPVRTAGLESNLKKTPPQKEPLQETRAAGGTRPSAPATMRLEESLAPGRGEPKGPMMPLHNDALTMNSR